MIEIDGSIGEGGGQILRTACALSIIKQIPCRIFNIRKKRPRPGLQTQHLLAIRALAELSNSQLEGDYLGSTEIKFFPGKIVKERISLNIPTAGSITLILQALILAGVFTKNTLEILIEGGATDTFFSPTIDYFRFCFLKILEKIGKKVEIKIFKRGYYPTGKAKVKVNIYPGKIKPLNLLERGDFKKILIFSVASSFLEKKRVAERQAREAENLFKKLNIAIEKKIEYVKTDCPGSSLCLVAKFENTFLGADNLGRLGKRAEDIGKETAFALIAEGKKKGCLDKFLADQILPYLALTKSSKVIISEASEHFKTNILIIEKFLEGKFKVEKNLVSWQGI